MLKNRSEEEWGDVILAYDNMCHLDALMQGCKSPTTTARAIQGYVDEGASMTKIIGSLHIRDHVDPKCRKHIILGLLRKIFS